MIAPLQPHPVPCSQLDWHAAFLQMLPDIREQASIAFRYLHAEAKEEMISEVVANVYQAFARLVERGKEPRAFDGLIWYGIRQVRCGRRVGGAANVQDLTSPRARFRSGVRIHSLEACDGNGESWQEALVEHRQAGPAETAAVRIDFAQWLRSLDERQQMIADALGRGEEPSQIAQLLGLSRGRVSQLRHGLRQSWEAFQGN
jgi:hypothetical protein